MKRSAWLALALAVCLGPAGVASAQRRGRIVIRPQIPPEHGPGGHRVEVDYPSPEKRAANLTELLGLSDDQKQKVQAIFLEQDKESTAAWADTSLTTAARGKKLDNIRDAALKKVRDLLTDEQRKKYDAIGAGEKPAVKPVANATPK